VLPKAAFLKTAQSGGVLDVNVGLTLAYAPSEDVASGGLRAGRRRPLDGGGTDERVLG
jgi:hypothetical protein